MSFEGEGQKTDLSNNYEITDFSEEALIRSLCQEPCTRNVDSPHFKYLYGYLRKLNCSTIFIEKEYVDRDFLDSYSHYYSKCFK